MMPSVKINRWLIVLSSCLLLFALLSGGCVQSFYYYPDQVNYGSPLEQGLSFEKVKFNSQDGTSLSGWFVPAKKGVSPREAKGTVIHFHGNAQNISAHWSFVSWLPEAGYNVFTFDYRGYGDSAGKAEPKGIYEDSLAALDYIRSRTDIDPTKLFVFAQSLGGNNAIAAIGSGNRKGIRAVAVESTFYSYPSIANDKFRYSGLFVSDRYSAYRYIQKISPIPLLLIHGKQDSVIGYQHSLRLFDLAQEPKQLILVPNGEHIGAMDARFQGKYRTLLTKFYQESLKN